MTSNLLLRKQNSQPITLTTEVEEFILFLQNHWKQNEKRSTLDWSHSQKIAECVLKASQFYIDQPAASTPWNEAWMQIAQICYFLPLNFIRCLMAAEEGHRLDFFRDLKFSFDFGMGLGAGSLALQTLLHKEADFHFAGCDLSAIPMAWLQQANQQNKLPRSVRPISPQNLKQEINLKNTVVLSSYSMTELPELPLWMLDAEALMIVEPSTQQDGRKLMALREKLVTAGYFIWAPCTHQNQCPLLHQSKTDWCHDRVHCELPTWFQDIEAHLPIKNRTITWSYLLARKTPPTHNLSQVLRTVGDQLHQKGKTRQLICRGPEREFVAWMHRHGEPPVVPRGVLFQAPIAAEKVSDELRLTASLDPISLSK